MAVAGVIDAKDRIVKANFFMKGLLPATSCTNISVINNNKNTSYAAVFSYKKNQ